MIILCFEMMLVGGCFAGVPSPEPSLLGLVGDAPALEEADWRRQESQSMVASRRLLITVDFPTPGAPRTVMLKGTLSMTAARCVSKLRSKRAFVFGRGPLALVVYCIILSRNHLSVGHSGRMVSLADRLRFTPKGASGRCPAMGTAAGGVRRV